MIESSEEKKQTKFTLLGFRSKKAWKMILSILYMMFCLFIVLGCMVDGKVGQITIYDFVINKIYSVILCFCALTPYVFLSNSRLRDKLPLFKRHKIGASTCGMIIILIVIIMISGFVDSFHSEEYLADMSNHAYVEECRDEEKGEISFRCEYCGQTAVEKIEVIVESMQEASGEETEFVSEGVTEANPTQRLEETEKENTKSGVLHNSESVKDLDSIYSKLSDEDLKILTEMIAKSFYSFTVDDSDYVVLESKQEVMDCLTSIYDYAWDNGFELDPDYCAVFAAKNDVISTISNYDLLKENFIVGYSCDSELKGWSYTINSYSFNQEDVIDSNGELYIDAEGYLAPGVVVYWEEEGKMIPVGEIEEIAYNKQIYDIHYPYAINVNYYDAPDDSGWIDGEIFLRVNKKLTGKPLYYIQVLDAKRRIIKEEIDFKGDIVWIPIKEIKLKSGTEVYCGALSAKGLLFTIIEINEKRDLILVQYPSGMVEYKSYSAIISNETLFVK